MNDDSDHNHGNSKRLSSHPFSFLTEEDVCEVDRLDLPLGEHQAWMWNRGVSRMIKAIFPDTANSTDTWHTAADQNKLPRINYYALWRSEQEAKTKRRKAWKDAARHAAKRAERESEGFKALDAIKQEGALRLKLLRAGTKKPRSDKRLEQLRGQEEVYVKTWTATQLANLTFGPGVSAAKIAARYSEHFPGEAVTRHQIRTWSKTINELEQPGGVWAPDCLIARLEKGKAALSK
ncbi:hypothetical protein [Microvirga arabica]|uniref:hypothetical protein n=1 Tax=Microvirga arabica TaxID=1128671 RepID=UPI00193978C1|nr:hypothetical protein [Microvirga arabica]MBM1170352.1 hypothetical protein [Microvirga arabica]